MERVLTKDLREHIGKEVTVSGWVETRRDHGKLIFIDLRDRSGEVQMVALPNHEEAHGNAQSVRAEWVIAARGIVNERPEKMRTETPNGDIEIELIDLTVLAPADELPFDKDAELNLDTLLDYRPLTIRRKREQAIFKVQHEIVRGYREALTAEGFYEFEAPKLVGGDAEGGAAAFPVEYLYEKTAYLATSPQLHKQIMVGALERVFAVGNVFRGEKHATTRHLSEYTSLDAEMGFIENHTDVMRALTKALSNLVRGLKERGAREFEMLGAEIPDVPEAVPFLKLRAAQKLLSDALGEDVTGEKDLAPEHERWLSQWAKKEHNSEFVFITHFPIEKTAFYAYEDPDDPGYTRYFDLLFRGVEIASGGQRVHDYETLKKRIALKGLEPEKFSFYLQAFKWGMPPHGGWGMGLERLTQKMLNLENIKEATLFPRDINRIDIRLSE
jgi:nondiscriminating aspartyl-tRNA synthetase